MIRSLLRALALCCLLPLAGCWESPLPEGVVATVNGEAIHIRTVQAYMDGNSPGLGTRNQPPDTNQLRRDYGEAVEEEKERKKLKDRGASGKIYRPKKVRKLR